MSRTGDRRKDRTRIRRGDPARGECIKRRSLGTRKCLGCDAVGDKEHGTFRRVPDELAWARRVGKSIRLPEPGENVRSEHLGFDSLAFGIPQRLALDNGGNPLAKNLNTQLVTDGSALCWQIGVRDALAD